MRTDAPRGPSGRDGPRFGLMASLLLFGAPALALWLATQRVVPALVAAGWSGLCAWFASGGAVFLLLLCAALLAARAEAGGTAGLAERLRVRPLAAADWKTLGRAFGVVGVTTFALALGLPWLAPELGYSPAFLHGAAATVAAAPWLLLVWLGFVALNVVGEEFWWRGYVQPRQEPVFGRATWCVQGVLHLGFHAGLGAGVVLLLVPAAFAMPWAAQRARNTTVALALHAGVNGGGVAATLAGLAPT